MRKFFMMIASLLVSSHAFADQHEIIEQYISDLGRADYKHITSLFTKNAYVISTSRGKVDAKEFFYSFLPELASAHTQIKEIYDETNLKKAARFSFSFQMKDGEKGGGEYVDIFVFDDSEKKLSAVYMFENLHFEG